MFRLGSLKPLVSLYEIQFATNTPKQLHSCYFSTKSDTEDTTIVPFHIYYFRGFFDDKGVLNKPIDTVHDWLEKRTIEPSHALKWLLKQYKSGDAAATSNILHTMPSFGVQPDEVTYSLVISRYCTEKKLSKAFFFLNEMRYNNLQPGEETVSALLRLCLETDHLMEASKIIHTIIKKDQLPNAMLLKEVAHRLLEHRSYTELARVTSHLEKFMPLNNLQLDRLIKETSREYPGRAYMAIQKLHSTSFVPSSLLFNALISNFIKHNEQENAFLVPELIKECGSSLDLSHLKILLGASCSVGNLDLSEEYISQIRALNNNSLPLISSIILLGGYMDAGAYERGVTFLNELKKYGNVNPALIESVYQWYSEKGEHTLAEQVKTNFRGNFKSTKV